MRKKVNAPDDWLVIFQEGDKRRKNYKKLVKAFLFMGFMPKTGGQLSKNSKLYIIYSGEFQNK